MKTARRKTDDALNTPAADGAANGAGGMATMPGPADDRIAQRAYEFYQARGGGDGNDLDDWLQAERELRGGQSSSDQ
jgi:hypothetical protein